MRSSRNGPEGPGQSLLFAGLDLREENGGDSTALAAAGSGTSTKARSHVLSKFLKQRPITCCFCTWTLGWLSSVHRTLCLNPGSVAVLAFVKLQEGSRTVQRRFPNLQLRSHPFGPNHPEVGLWSIYHALVVIRYDGI